MLARQQHLPDHVIVREGGSQVDHQLDLRIGGDLLHGHDLFNAIGPGLLFGAFPPHIADRGQVDDGEQLLQIADVDIADHAAADHSGFHFSDFFHGSSPPEFLWVNVYPSPVHIIHDRLFLVNHVKGENDLLSSLFLVKSSRKQQKAGTGRAFARRVPFSGKQGQDVFF